jgi:hypothetical protein
LKVEAAAKQSAAPMRERSPRNRYARGATPELPEPSHEVVRTVRIGTDGHVDAGEDVDRDGYAKKYQALGSATAGLICQEWDEPADVYAVQRETAFVRMRSRRFLRIPPA